MNEWMHEWVKQCSRICVHIYIYNDLVSPPPLYLVFCWNLVHLGIFTHAKHMLKSISLGTTCSYAYSKIKALCTPDEHLAISILRLYTACISSTWHISTVCGLSTYSICDLNTLPGQSIIKPRCWLYSILYFYYLYILYLYCLILFCTYIYPLLAYIPDRERGDHRYLYTYRGSCTYIPFP